MKHGSVGRRDHAPWMVPPKAVIRRARNRLDVEPVRAPFEGAHAPLASKPTWSDFHGGLRTFGSDDASLDVADTSANVASFGRPASHRPLVGDAYPQVRLVTAGEAGTHAIADAAIDPYATSEQPLANLLPSRLQPR